MVQVNQTVKHGADTYEPNIDYDLDKDTADYFAGNGWLVGTERPRPGSTVTEEMYATHDIVPENPYDNSEPLNTVLEVDNSVLGSHSDEVIDNG